MPARCDRRRPRGAPLSRVRRKNEASAGGSAGTSAAAREPETYRQDVIPWSNADPTRRVRSALHPERSPDRPTSPRAAPRTACVGCVATVGKPETRPERARLVGRLTSRLCPRRRFLFRKRRASGPAAPAPLRKLATTGLIDVYKRINRNYYETRSWRSSREAPPRGQRTAPAPRARAFETAVPAGVGSADASARRSEVLGGSRRRSHPLSSSAGGRLGSHTSVQSGASWRVSGGAGHGGSPADRDAPTVRASTAPRHLLHDRYAVGRVIGRGAFARVVVAYDIVTDARVAIKIIRNASRSFHARARKEIEILRVLGGGGAREALVPRARAERTRGAIPTLSPCSTTSRFAEATTRQGCSVLRSQHTRMTTPTRLPPPQRRRDGVIRPRTRMGFGVWCLSSCRTLCTTCFAPRRSEAYRWRSCASSRSRSCTRCGTSSRTGWCT